MSELEEIQRLKQHISKNIVGQERLIDRLLIGLLADGHLLVEGAPGLAKTRAVKVLSEGVEGDFQRIQFTPDLLPADVTGTEIYRSQGPQEGTFTFQAGPLFHNLVLADEINRAPAKVQSALLEAMAERQVTVAGKTYALPRLFLVMATQNPIEQEGTYTLPEAQLDRFLMHVRVDYPNAAEEKRILALTRREALAADGSQDDNQDVIGQAALFSARERVLSIHMGDNVEGYLLQLVLATRNMGAYGDDIAHWLQWGGSPRASIGLDRCARAHAWLQGRDYVSPDDVQAVAHDVLRHRIILDYEAVADGVTADKVISELISRIAVP